ncbi:MAG: hypothetical protein JSS86_13055 [Cyanobacteria bacterium SZAS LIN-2]|nr:hypothetical protein [Cyanobacteria bacterium SZAS LIN-2]
MFAPAAWAGPAKAVVENGVILKQKSGYVDQFTQQVTPTAVRVDINSHDYYIISRAPDWKVSIVRPKSKEMAVVSHHDWCYKLQVRHLSWTTALRKPEAISRSTEEGRPIITYRYGPTEVYGSLLAMTSDTHANTPVKRPNHSEIICFDYPGSDKTGPIFGRIKGLPPVRGLVLRAYRKEVGGNVAGAVETVDTNARAKIAGSVFDIPTGYKIVPFSSSLVQTQAASENSKALIEDFMSK